MVAAVNKWSLFEGLIVLPNMSKNKWRKFGRPMTTDGDFGIVERRIQNSNYSNNSMEFFFDLSFFVDGWIFP
jgi:hypothetical protein